MRWLIFFILLGSFALAQPLNICSGCSYNDRCIGYNSQISSPQGMLYCSEDSKLYPAKPDGASCATNSECLSFVCMSGVCGSSKPEVLVFNSHSSFLFLGIVFGVLLFSALVFFLLRYGRVNLKVPIKMISSKSIKKGKGPAKQQPVMPTTVKLMPMKKKYSQFESFEKRLEETSKKIHK